MYTTTQVPDCSRRAVKLVVFVARRAALIDRFLAFANYLFERTAEYENEYFHRIVLGASVGNVFSSAAAALTSLGSCFVPHVITY